MNLIGVPDNLFTPVKEELKTEINKVVSESGHLKRTIVDELPSSGIDNIIYMKSKAGQEGNIYDEYMWINRKWERIGSSEVDLSNYPTKQALEESMTRTLTEAKQYTDQEKSKYVPLAGNVSISNQITINAEPVSAKHIATKQYVDNINASMIEAENRRETAEGKREASEVKRATAESQRVLAETERVSSENARKEAETARVAAEQARQTAEENRSQTFSNSLASWEQQVSAETTKANQATVEANKAVATANKASETANTAIGKMNETLERVPIVAENILTGTATGVIAHADDVYTSKALGFNIYGKSEQVTTTGANLFLPIKTTSLKGIDFTANDDGSYSVKGTQTMAFTRAFSSKVPLADAGLAPGDTVYLNCANASSSCYVVAQFFKSDGSSYTMVGTNSTGQKWTVDALATHIYVFISLDGTVGTKANATLYPMLTKKQGIPWEPYTDGKPSPSPKYPRDITNVANADIAIAGKNLVEKAIVYSNTARFATVLKLKMELFPSTQYCLSFEDVKDNQYYLNEALFEYQRITSTGSRQFLLLRTKDVLDKSNRLQFDPINGCWLVLKNDKEQSNAPQLKNVQVEIGGENTPYEASSKPITLPIDLKGHELCSLPNGVRDEVRIDKDGNIELVKRTWKLRKRIGDMNNDEKYPGWMIPFSEMTCPLVGGFVDAHITGFSTHFYTFYGKYTEPQTKWLIYTVDVGATQSELIAQYPDEVVSFVGGLHEPIIIPLGKIDMPTLPAPIANVWANSENPTDVKFSYIRDVNIAYDKLASALANAMNTPTTIPELEL